MLRSVTRRAPAFARAMPMPMPMPMSMMMMDHRRDAMMPRDGASGVVWRGLRVVGVAGVARRAGTAAYSTTATAAASSETEDVVIVGGGPGGYVAAIKAAQLGLKVTCVEGRGTLGGTCLNVGCIPSKALLNASHKYEEAKHSFGKYGITFGGGEVAIDVPTMMAQKMKSVDGLTKGIEGLFKKNKVTYARGWGKLTSANTVQVTSEDGSVREISTKNVVLATGSVPSKLPGVDVDEETIVTSTGALALKKVPENLVVIGGGVIGLELGSVWSRLGAKVTVVEFANQICGPAIDDKIRSTFQRALKKQGFNFKLSTKVTKAEKKPGGGVTLTLEPSAGGDATQLDADIVLVSTGRRPFTDGLGLEEVGVKTNRLGQVVIEPHTFKTSVPGVFAIGDIVEGPMLAHKAEEEGISIVEQIAGHKGHVNYDAIPSVIYTHPEVAWVGKTEQDVKAMGIEYNVGEFPFMANSRARTNDDAEGIVKIITDKKTDKILGAHIVGPNAGELIGECVLALEYGASSEDIARTCHAHPTLSEAVKEAALAAGGKAIHF
jgi:dihydrolipoamide dehydrogenase